MLKLAAVLELLDEPLFEDEPMFGQVCFDFAFEAAAPDSVETPPAYAGAALTARAAAVVDTLAAFTAW